MNSEDPDLPADVLELLASACNERLSPEEDERLAKCLAESAAAREAWVELSRLHVELHISISSQSMLQRSNDVIDDLIEGVGVGSSPALKGAAPAAAPPTREGVSGESATLRLSRWSGWSLALAAILLLAVYLGPQRQREDGERKAAVAAALANATNLAAPRYAERPQPDAVAVLTRQANAVWEDGAPLLDGVPLPPRKLRLLEGHAQVDMLSGVNLILQGPTEVSLVTPMRVICNSGRVRASVPEGAEGFVVETPTHRAVDLGTEFAVDVQSRDVSEIHVIDGVVVVEPVHAEQTQGAVTKLTSGQAIRSQPSGVVRRMPANVGAFLDAEKLMELSRERERQQRESWAAAEAGFRAREDLLLYYGFQDHPDWSKGLRQDGLQSLGALHGAIVGCDWSVGRFSGRRALEFKGTEDRVRLRIPGEFDSLTFHIWVRIDGLDRMYNSLLMTVGHDLGEPHWQINERGELVLGIKGYPNDYFGPPFNDKGNPILNHNYSTATVVGPNDLGVWMNLTSVFDAQRDEVRHYKNGVRQSTERLVREVKLRLGDCELGNWTPIGGTHQAVRALNGRIDELAVFDRPLTDEEILDLHQSGRP